MREVGGCKAHENTCRGVGIDYYLSISFYIHKLLTSLTYIPKQILGKGVSKNKKIAYSQAVIKVPK